MCPQGLRDADKIIHWPSDQANRLPVIKTATFPHPPWSSIISSEAKRLLLQVDHFPLVLSVCLSVGSDSEFWKNGWLDRDADWRGRRVDQRNCVLDGGRGQMPQGKLYGKGDNVPYSGPTYSQITLGFLVTIQPEENDTCVSVGGGWKAESTYFPCRVPPPNVNPNSNTNLILTLLLTLTITAQCRGDVRGGGTVQGELPGPPVSSVHRRKLDLHALPSSLSLSLSLS